MDQIGPNRLKWTKWTVWTEQNQIDQSRLNEIEWTELDRIGLD